MKMALRFWRRRRRIDPLAWPLAAGAALARYHGWQQPLTLWGDKPTGWRRRQARRYLRRHWDIEQASQWEETAEWLLEEGQRLAFHREIADWLEKEEGEQAAHLTGVDAGEVQSEDEATRAEQHARLAWVQQAGPALLEQSFMGWDLLRLIDLSRWALRAGYTDVFTARSYLLAAAQVLQQRAKGFAELYQQYLAGWRYWSTPDYEQRGPKLERAVRYWAKKRRGPWQRIPWYFEGWENRVDPSDESTR